MEAALCNHHDLIDRPVNVQELLGEQDINHSFGIPDKEVIPFSRNIRFSTEVLLCSVVSYNDQVFLVGGESANEIALICETHKLHYKIKRKLPTPALLQQMIANHSNLSAIFLVLDDLKGIKEAELEAFISQCSKYRIEVILYDKGFVFNDEFFKLEASYVISSDRDNPDHSVIIARRSSLVKTEGVSPDFIHDLYSYWQYLLRKRDVLSIPFWA